MIKKKYKVEGMDCTSCAMVIESDLEDVGVKAKCSYATQKLEVEFDSVKVKEDQIKKIVEASGFVLS